MLSFLRAPQPPRLYRADQNPIIYENGRSSLEFRERGAKYTLRNVHPPLDDDPSIMVPPFHWHINQSEHFSIVSGSIDLFAKKDDKPWKTLSDAPGAEKTAVIPKKIPHRLQNTSSTQPLIVDVHLSPEEYEQEQRFFRNQFGYLDDCKRAGKAPSVVQLIVFLHREDTPVWLPIAPLWLGLFVSRIFMVVVAAWGRWALGYKSSYPEYYDEKKSL